MSKRPSSPIQSPTKRVRHIAVTSWRKRIKDGYLRGCRAVIERPLQRSPAPEVDQKIRELRKEFSGGETEDGWREVLSRYGVSDQELHDAVSFQLDALRLIDARLRPTVQADQASIEEYYRRTYLPSVHRAGSKPQPLSEVVVMIKEVLAQQKMGDLTAAWLQNLRAQSEIRWSIAEKLPATK